MKTAISLFDTGTLVFEQATRPAPVDKLSISAKRYAALAVLGILLAVAVYATLSAIAPTVRFHVMGATAAGLGLINLWQGFDSGRLGRVLIGAGAGITVVTLAIAATPANAGLLALAFLISGLSAAINHSRESGLWVPTASLALSLAVLSLA